MGAWNYGVFDDDTAYDFEQELKTDPRSFFTASFENAINATYLEYTDCHAVTVSAAYLDHFLNGTTYRTDNEEANDETNINLFRTLQPNLVLSHLKPIAKLALAVVIGNRSELNELWAENEELYPKWKGNIQAMIDRLN